MVPKPLLLHAAHPSRGGGAQGLAEVAPHDRSGGPGAADLGEAGVEERGQHPVVKLGARRPAAGAGGEVDGVALHGAACSGRGRR